jgi:hypothetical protein
MTPPLCILVCEQQQAPAAEECAGEPEEVVEVQETIDEEQVHTLCVFSREQAAVKEQQQQTDGRVVMEKCKRKVENGGYMRRIGAP